MRGKREKVKIDPDAIKTRNPLIVELIKGATKAAVHVDRKKRESKWKCRAKVDPEGE